MSPRPAITTSTAGIVDRIARPMIDPIALARQLIDIPSTTDNEAAVGEFLESRLSALGYACRRHAVTETRFNLFAAAGGRPRVILNSHIDTVPPWFAPREDAEYLYGRGACDTKGVYAAMIAAAGTVKLQAGERARLDLNADVTLRLQNLDLAEEAAKRAGVRYRL